MDFCISLNRKSPIIDVSTVTPGWKLIRVELWNQNTNSGCPTLSLRRKIILNKSRSGKSDHLFTQPAKKENLSGRIEDTNAPINNWTKWIWWFDDRGQNWWRLSTSTHRWSQRCLQDWRASLLIQGSLRDVGEHLHHHHHLQHHHHLREAGEPTTSLSAFSPLLRSLPEDDGDFEKR